MTTDNSFLRLRDNFTDAKDLRESRVVDKTLAQYTQIHLCPGETYFQISNSPTAIIFNDNYEVFAVDECGNEVEDVTANIFIEEFFDKLGKKQIKWEFINELEYYFKPLSLRFRNTVNEDTWWTNLFISTVCESEMTTYIEYKHSSDWYGTEYSRANNYQAIRLSIYKSDDYDDIEVQAYTAVTTGRTISNRPTISERESFVLDTFNSWTQKRLARAILGDECYFDSYCIDNTEPAEFKKREMDSNFFENELIINAFYEITKSYEFQIFEGLIVTQYLPLGTYTQATIENEGKATFNVTPTLNTGTVTLYDASDDSVVSTFTENELSIEVNDLYIETLNAALLPNGSYYLHISSGLISALGVEFAGINDNTTWAFTLTDGDYSSTDYNTSDYLTN